MPFQFVCRQCSEPFVSRYQVPTRVFCSYACKADAQRGKRASSWKGGRFVDDDGYVMVWIPKQQKYVKEHRLIVEKVLGRPLKKNEVIHHINMIKTDNRNTNLLVCTQAYHMELEARYAREFAKRFDCCD